MPTQIDKSKLENFVLLAGSHKSFEDGACVMELAAHLAGLPHSDSPACTDPADAAYCRVGNDGMPYAVRQRFLQYMPLIVNTADGPERTRKKAEHYAWAAVTRFAPVCLDRAGFHERAEKLRNAKREDGWEACEKLCGAAWAAEAARYAEAAAWAAEATWAAEAARAAADWNLYFQVLEEGLAII